MTDVTAEKFIERLQALQSREELMKHRRFFKFDPDNQPADKYFIGVRMGDIFQTSKDFLDMPVEEIERLMESPIYEARTGALSIMGKAAGEKKVSPERLGELYDLYIRRHDRIDDWGLVDLGAYQVVGRYLEDKPRDILYELAARTTGGGAGRRLSQRRRLSNAERSMTPIGSPRCFWVTRKILFTRAPGGCCVMPVIRTGRVC